MFRVRDRMWTNVRIFMISLMMLILDSDSGVVTNITSIFLATLRTVKTFRIARNLKI